MKPLNFEASLLNVIKSFFLKMKFKLFNILSLKLESLKISLLYLLSEDINGSLVTIIGGVSVLTVSLRDSLEIF